MTQPAPALETMDRLIRQGGLAALQVERPQERAEEAREEAAGAPPVADRPTLERVIEALESCRRLLATGT